MGTWTPALKYHDGEIANNVQEELWHWKLRVLALVCTRPNDEESGSRDFQRCGSTSSDLQKEKKSTGAKCDPVFTKLLESKLIVTF